MNKRKKHLLHELEIKKEELRKTCDDTVQSDGGISTIFSQSIYCEEREFKKYCFIHRLD